MSMNVGWAISGLIAMLVAAIVVQEMEPDEPWEAAIWGCGLFLIVRSFVAVAIAGLGVI